MNQNPERPTPRRTGAAGRPVSQNSPRAPRPAAAPQANRAQLPQRAPSVNRTAQAHPSSQIRSAVSTARPAQQRAQANAAAVAASRRILIGRIVLFVVLFALLALASWGIFNLFLHTHSGKPFPYPPVSAGTSSTPEAPLSTLDTEGMVIPDPIEDPGTQYEYRTDVSAYLQYIDPADNAEYLILVNTENRLSSTDVPPDLTDVVDTRGDRATLQMRLAAEKALEAFLREAREYGYSDVTVTSAYRSYNTQDYLFNYYVSKEMQAHTDWTRAQAEAYVMTYSCRPGTSEHQSGLCIDMHNLPAADVSFANQPVAKWLAENCWRFGFVLRFPEDKVSITGISYEPWHFRFVGRTAAVEMTTLNMCLEEYVAYLASK